MWRYAFAGHRLVSALTVGLAVSFVGCFTEPALAAFPGRDGLIAFSETDAFGNQTVHAVDPGSGRRRRLTAVPPSCRTLRNSWLDDVPVFSASGRYVYYSHSGDCDRSMPDGLYRTAVGGGAPRLVVRDRAGLVSWWPAPTAGGRRLLFISDLPISPRRDRDEFQDRIYSASTAGDRPRRLSPARAKSDEFPAVSGTGRIVFSRDHRRLLVGRRPGELGRLSRTLVSMRHGTFASSDWSPRGRHVVFEYQPGGHFRSDIYLVRARGGRIRRLTRARNAVSPVWSPSGRWIAFSRSPDKHPTTGPLYIIRPNGRGLRKILGSIDETRLSWQPLPRARRRGGLR